MFWHFPNSPVLKFRQFLHSIDLLAADLQVCGLYSFRIDVSMKSFLTHFLIESIAAALKGLSYVMNKALVSAISL